MFPINRKLFVALLSCVLLLSCSFVPTAGADVPVYDSAILRVSGRLDHSFPANKITPITQPFSLAEGDIIQYDCTYTPKSASLDFGYIAPDGLFYYLNITNGSIDQSIEVGRNGQYTLAIRNNESYAVTVKGTVKY